MSAAGHYRKAEDNLREAIEARNVGDVATCHDLLSFAMIHADLAKVGAAMLAEQPHGNRERQNLLNAVSS